MFFSFQVQHFSEFIPKAFPTGDDLILDAEVLLVDTNTSKPLPFGTLGVHKVRWLHLIGWSKYQQASTILYFKDAQGKMAASHWLIQIPTNFYNLVL